MYPYLNFEEQLITGKNMPSKLKLRKLPLIGTPLNVKLIIGTFKSRAQPTTSPIINKIYKFYWKK